MPQGIKQVKDVIAGKRRFALINGDSLDFLPHLPRNCVDLVLTDPPYSSGGLHSGSRKADPRSKYVASDAKHKLVTFSGDNRDQRSYMAWSALWMRSAILAAKPGAILSVFTDWRQLPTTTDAIQVGGWVWRGLAVWPKKNARPVLGRYTNQCEYIPWATNGPRATTGPTAKGWRVEPTVPGRRRQHITEKPLPVMQWLLEPVVADGLVLDPFMGSGSSGEACMREGYRYIGIELDPTNFNIAKERITKAAREMVHRPKACLARRTHFTLARVAA